MLEHLKTFAIIAVALCLLVDRAFAQGATPDGFHFHRDDAGQVTVAQYWGETGLRNAKLHELNHLECVDISYGTQLTKDDVTYLATLTELKELVIGQDSVDSPVSIEGDLSKLENLTNLEYVHLCIRDIKDSDLKFIASLPKLTHLEFIAETSFGDSTDLTDECGDFLASAKSLKNIYVEGEAEFSDRFVSKITADLPLLTSLDLSSEKLSDVSLRLLATRSKKINCLNLHSNKLTDAGLRHLAGATSLKELRLYSDSLSKACLLHLAELNEIEDIELTIPAIDDAGVTVLAGLRKLESLILREVEFSDKQILMFRNHPRFERAFLQGSNLSADVVVKLIDEIPNLEYLSVGSKNPDLQALVNRTLLGKTNTRD